MITANHSLTYQNQHCCTECKAIICDAARPYGPHCAQLMCLQRPRQMTQELQPSALT